jgi:hypothetical protein
MTTTPNVSALRLIIALLISTLLVSCGTSDNKTHAQNGAGIAFQLKWPVAKIVGSAPVGVTKVRMSVSGSDMTTMSNDFDSAAGIGSITNVPVGAGRTITFQGLNASSTVLYQATVPNITLVAGQTFNTGPVTMTSVAPPVVPPVVNPNLPAPTGMTASLISTNKIRLAWVDNANNETGYKIERKTGTTGTYIQIGTAGENAAGYVDSILAASTTFYYRVRTTNSAGDSEYSAELPGTTLANDSGTRFSEIALPKTGQTVCYNSTGTAITCGGTGQDGGLQTGTPWPVPRFVDNGDQTATDKLTKLIWTKDGNPAASTKTWQEALDYIKSLNSSNYLGHNDWYLPNRIELMSLGDINGQTDSSSLIAQGFTNALGSKWTSTTYPDDPISAFVVVPSMTGTYWDKKSIKYDVWPVRGGTGGSNRSRTGQITCYNATGAIVDCIGTGQDGNLQNGVEWPYPRFTDNRDLTVIDKLTGLIWAKDSNPVVAKNWQDVLDYVKGLNSSSYQGHNDWRLPNQNEILSLVNNGQTRFDLWLGTQGFSNVAPANYWTSDTYAINTSRAWVVNVCYGGNTFDSDKATTSNFVWPVRGGQ